MNAKAFWGFMQRLGFRLTFVGKPCPAQPEMRYPAGHQKAGQAIEGYAFVPCPEGEDEQWEHYHLGWRSWTIAGWQRPR